MLLFRMNKCGRRSGICEISRITSMAGMGTGIISEGDRLIVSIVPVEHCMQTNHTNVTNCYFTLHSFFQNDHVLVKNGSWTEINFLQSKRWSQLCLHVPKTCAWLQSRSELTGQFPAQHTAMVDLPRSAGIFRMLPGTRLHPHTGPVNFHLLVHIGISVPQGPWIQVGNTPRRKWVEGKSIIFDDSYVHEAGHDGLQPRYVLFASIYHPDLGQPGHK